MIRAKTELGHIPDFFSVLRGSFYYPVKYYFDKGTFLRVLEKHYLDKGKFLRVLEKHYPDKGKFLRVLEK